MNFLPSFDLHSDRYRTGIEAAPLARRDGNDEGCQSEDQENGAEDE